MAKIGLAPAAPASPPQSILSGGENFAKILGKHAMALETSNNC